MSDTYLIPQFIIDYLQKSRSDKSPQKLNSMRLTKNKTPEIEKWFKDNEVTAGYLWKNFVCFGMDKFTLRKCPVCGKQLSSIQANLGNIFCSYKCSNLYNIKNSQEKAKQTCLERYGVENPFQAEKIKEKIRKTNLTKFGVENPNQSQEIIEKRKQTCVERYGVCSFSKTKEYKEKYKETCLKKYGVNSPNQSEGVKEKFKQTCLEKYGVNNPNKFKKIREKSKETQRSNYWDTFCYILKERNVSPLFSKEEYIKDIGRKFKCLCCNKEFLSDGLHKLKEGTYSTLHAQNIYCPYCHKAPYSKKEKEVLEYVKSIYHDDIIENDRIQLCGKELDIFLPKLNLGIEFNGDYWHSLETIKERDKQKYELCKKHNIKLLRIKESDWDDNPDKIKEEIKYFLSEGK